MGLRYLNFADLYIYNMKSKISSNFLDNLCSADFATRYDDEELAAILPHTDLDSAYTVVDKI